MCLGIPMRVVSADGVMALCSDAKGRVRHVDTLLLGEAPVPGEMLLVHVASAVRRLDAEEARLIAEALEALDRAMAGESLDGLFADLTDREPQLPPHLQAAHGSRPARDGAQDGE